jgi:hypothetical protein
LISNKESKGEDSKGEKLKNRREKVKVLRKKKGRKVGKV